MAVGKLSCWKGKTMKVQMDVSLYPFGVRKLWPPIKAFVDTLRSEGFEVEVGPLGSFVTGESQALFPALGRAFEHVAKKRRCALVTKIARLVPESSTESDR